MTMKILILWSVTLAILYQDLHADTHLIVTQLNNTHPNSTQLNIFKTNGTNPSSTLGSSTQLNNTQTSSTQINVTQVNNNQQDDIEDTGECGSPIDLYKNCVLNTCSGRCGDRANYSIPGSLCSCDNACTIYGDCCKDFKSKCGNFSQGDFVQLKPTDFTCKKHAPDKYVFMRVTCKPSYSNEAVIKECYMNSGFEGMVPVSDPKTEIVYSNYFCALCNDVTYVVPWELTVMCKKAGLPKNDIRWSELMLSFLNSNIVGRRCDIYTQPSIALKSVIPVKCAPVDSKCSWRCRDPSIIKLCKNGEYDPQYDQFGLVRNNHCFQCLNYGLRDKCPFGDRKSIEQLVYMFSYTLLLDVVEEAVFSVKLKSGFGINKINSEAEIDHGEVRLTTCGAPFVLINGKCELDGMYIAVLCDFDIDSSNVTYTVLTQDQEISISGKIREIYDAIGLVGLDYRKRSDMKLRLKWYVSMPFETGMWRLVHLEYEKTFLNYLKTIFPCILSNECSYTKSKAGSKDIPRIKQTINVSSNKRIESGLNNQKTINSSSSTVENKLSPEFIILILTLCFAWTV
ncbi:unnamed protein product [Owenia fusiformis]|uniref:Uncharacterized protein n=1 Tax=Owenia fusiformis TaxID=6347 RepID=A0A8J1TDC9_OWEFU|nr:unnamed protein product [Owenia fusiformis]